MFKEHYLPLNNLLWSPISLGIACALSFLYITSVTQKCVSSDCAKSCGFHLNVHKLIGNTNGQSLNIAFKYSLLRSS